MRKSWPFLVIMVAMTAAIWYFSVNTCQLPLQCRDSSAVVALEERDLLHEVKTGVFYPPGPKPLTVRISGRDATLTVAGPVEQNWLYYANVWYEVFQRYHGGRNFVRMHIVWKSGDMHQVFPVTNL